MTVIGDDIVLNCKNCWNANGYSIKLQKSGDNYRCPHCRTQYKVKNGFIQEIK